jgi:hypothetical protein
MLTRETKSRLGNILYVFLSGLALIITGLILYGVAEQWMGGRVLDETDLWSIVCAGSIAVVGLAHRASFSISAV